MFFQRKTYACKRKLSSPQNTLAFRCQASNLSRSGVQRSGVHPLPRLRPHHGLKKFENTAFISTVNPTVHTSPEELAVVVVKKKKKTNDGFSENASDVFVLTTPEEFENEGFSLKMRYQMFFINTTRGIWKRNNQQSIWIRVWENSHDHRLRKSPVFKMFSPTLKASFSLGISVDGRPNWTNNPPFSHYSSFKVWTRPNPSR